MNEPQEAQPGSENLNPDLAGYPNQEALVKGYRESGNEAKRQRERAEAAERTIQELHQSMANPRPQVPSRPARPEDQLSEFGVPVEALGDFVRGTIRSELEPLSRAASARTELLARHPDYAKFEPDVASFIDQELRTDPMFQRVAISEPLAALELAFFKFAESRRKTVGNQPDSALEHSHAAIPGGRNGDAMRQMPQGNAAEIERARQEYARTGSPQAAAAYAKARLHTVVTDEFLNQ